MEGSFGFLSRGSNKRTTVQAGFQPGQPTRADGSCLPTVQASVPGGTSGTLYKFAGTNAASEPIAVFQMEVEENGWCNRSRQLSDNFDAKQAPSSASKCVAVTRVDLRCSILASCLLIFVGGRAPCLSVRATARTCTHQPANQPAQPRAHPSVCNSTDQTMQTLSRYVQRLSNGSYDRPPEIKSVFFVCFAAFCNWRPRLDELFRCCLVTQRTQSSLPKVVKKSKDSISQHMVHTQHQLCETNNACVCVCATLP